MIRIYNTLTKKTDQLEGKKLKLFVCGITPYDFAHLGNARTYIVFDAFVKYLRAAGKKVFYLQNVTDVDDKIIKRAKEAGLTWKELARKFEKEYLKSMKALKVDSVDKYARATEHIKEIVSQVKRMQEKGFAYEIKDDGIYFDISKFQDYGKLSGRTGQQAQDAVSRIDESVKKRNKGDFALWKFSKQGEPSWPSPLGKGRPGWHIEDTAISEKYFGSQYDIHGGGIDLLFPHHEAEVTQMESVSGKKPFVRYWMHTGFLTIRGEKMSKSLGNFIMIHDFLQNNSPRVLRFLFLKSHYRSPINYSKELIAQAERELGRIDEFLQRLKRMPSTAAKKDKAKGLAKKTEQEFFRALDQDFNTVQAVASLLQCVSAGNAYIDEGAMTKSGAVSLLKALLKIDKVLGFIFWPKKASVIPSAVQKLVEQREESRKQQDWAKADQIRVEIEKQGWQAEDTPQGTRVRRKT